MLLSGSCNKVKLIFLLVLIVKDFIFRISILSATAATGLFSGSRLINFILEIFETTFPFHLLGLKGLIGVTASFLESKFRIGPCTDKLYAVLPAGVDIRTPSPINFLIKVFFPISNLFFQAELKREISLDEIIFFFENLFFHKFSSILF